MDTKKTTSAGKWSVSLAVIPVGIALILALLFAMPILTGQAYGEAAWGPMVALYGVLYFGGHVLTVTSLLGMVVGVFAIRKSKWQKGTLGILLNLSVLIIAGSCLTIFYYKQATDPNRLLIAVKRGDYQTVEKLINRGFDINYLYGHGTVLSHAVEQGQMQFVEFLLKHGADVNADDTLERAVSKANPEVVKMLLNHGAANLDSTLEKIMISNKKVDPANVKILLDYGANPNCLHTRNTEIARLLLEYQADVNQRDQKGETPLHYAVKGDNKELIELLLDWDADVNAQDEIGNTPLHVAIDYSLNKMAIELLINRGANLNIQNKKGRTPLHELFIIHRGNKSGQQLQIELCELLLANGADPDIKDNSGKNPLELLQSLWFRKRNKSQFQNKILELMQQYQNKQLGN